MESQLDIARKHFLHNERTCLLQKNIFENSNFAINYTINLLNILSILKHLYISKIKLVKFLLSRLEKSKSKQHNFMDESASYQLDINVT